jgi:hypothetical protein
MPYKDAEKGVKLAENRHSKIEINARCIMTNTYPNQKISQRNSLT